MFSGFSKKMFPRHRRFARDRKGGVAVTFAVSTPVLMGMTALAVDYNTLSGARVRLQELTDSAALAAARELRLGSAASGTALAVAQNFVNGNAVSVTPNPVNFSGTIGSDNASVTINLSADVSTFLAKSVGVMSATIGTRATAKLTSGPPICVVGLDTKNNWAIVLDQSARMSANGCSVFSNSPQPNGLASQSSSFLQSSYTCTVGGVGGTDANFSPYPKTGCPAIVDPLKGRATPPVAACDATKTNVVASSGVVSLFPGVYCGGLRVTGGATVNLMAGVYIMKNGDLRVDNGGTLNGNYVGFYFANEDSKINFDKTSNLSLGAPKDGVMAGMLFFQNPSVSDSKTFQIDSNNATKFLGTIYLPKGNLQFGGSAPVAQNSAFTIIVANSVYLSGGPTMFLNTNYNGTDVPVPKGLGSDSGTVALTN